jgi:hypothetical protein
VLNVSQQLGGSLGLAVLGTIAANVAREKLSAIEGFTTAFEIGAVIAIAGFVLAVALIRTRKARPVGEALPKAA